VLGLLAAPPAAEPAPAPPASAPLPALAARFEKVALPSEVGAVISVVGRGTSDVWMLARGNVVFHWDGARTTRRGTPRCFTDSCCARLVDCARQREACSPTCSLGWFGCAQAVDFQSLRLTADDVIAEAVVYTGGMRGALVAARLRGGFRCEQSSDDLVYPGQRASGDAAHAEELSVGGAEVRFEGPAMLGNALGGYSLSIDGRRIPLPDDAMGVDLAVAALDDLWLWQWSGGRVWRGNGLTWYPLATGAEQLAGLWVGEGMVWALATAEKEGAERLLRWDLERGGWHEDATPGATKLIHDEGGRFWLLGKTAQYHWDGRTLRRGEAPLDVEDGWLAATGELWLVGGDRSATVTTADGSAPAGAVVRLAAREQAP
jgi:hypothetical protein